MFSYRRTPQSTTGVAPSELLMGRKLISVLDLLNPTVNDRVDTAMTMQKDSHDKRAKQRSFNLGDIEIMDKDHVGSMVRLWTAQDLEISKLQLLYMTKHLHGRDTLIN